MECENLKRARELKVYHNKISEHPEMIIYEVNLTIKNEIKNYLKKWLKHHIKEILEINGILSATWFERLEEESSGRTLWTIHYFMKNINVYKNYIKNHAPRLREEGLRVFGGDSLATRRVLKVYGNFYETT